MRRLIFVALLAVICSTGCGATNTRRVTITRPPHPVYVGGVCNKTTAAICRGRWDARALLGLKERAAHQLGEEHGIIVRVVERDGHGLAGDAMALSFRIDVSVANGRVSRIDGLG